MDVQDHKITTAHWKILNDPDWVAWLEKGKNKFRYLPRQVFVDYEVTRGHGLVQVENK